MKISRNLAKDEVHRKLEKNLKFYDSSIVALIESDRIYHGLDPKSEIVIDDSSKISPIRVGGRRRATQIGIQLLVDYLYIPNLERENIIRRGERERES